MLAVGLIAGVLLAGLSLELAGFGHGWTAATSGLLAIVGAPLVAVALCDWAQQHRRLVLVGTGAYLVIQLAWFFVGLVIEDPYYLREAIRDRPIVLTSWLILFGLLQVAAVLSIRRFLPDDTNPDNWSDG